MTEFPRPSGPLFSRRLAAALGICGVVFALAGCSSTTSGKPESGSGATATSGQPGQGGQGGQGGKGGKGGKGGLFGSDGEDGADGADGNGG